MKTKIIPKLFFASLLLFAVTVFAADLDQAKSAGLVGERADGYLGFVAKSTSEDIVELVEDINAKRKVEYQRIAAANKLTLEQVEALAGRKTIDKTSPGDWIFLNGGWQKKK